MHSKLFSFGLGLWVLLAAPGCGSSDNKTVTQAALTEDGAKAKAVTFVPGTAGAVEQVAAEDRWAVTVSMSGGSEAVVELQRADGRLAEINSDKGPFEYDLPAAASDFMLYGKARSLALAAKPGQIAAWELKIDASVWEFYVKDAQQEQWEVKLDAKTGAVLSSVPKAARD